MAKTYRDRKKFYSKDLQAKKIRHNGGPHKKIKLKNVVDKKVLDNLTD